MSKNRSRNIKEKVTNKTYNDDGHLPPPHWFGEFISSDTNPKINQSNSSFYGDIDIVDNLSVSKSSSSSLSWGEDCEIEATQKVKYEYDKMNKVLSGLEPIPPYYDKDEYKLWIKTFPSLRSTKPSIKQNEPRHEHNNSLSNNSTRTTVIDDLLNKMCYKLTDLTTEPKVLDRRKTYKQKQPHKDNLQILRISPALIYEKPTTVEKRRRSTNYIEAMNFVNSNHREYASLPHLSQANNNSILGNGKMKNSDSLRRNGRKRQYTNKIVLPPLDVPLNQFRSISAIPLQQTKCSSAMSTKTNFVINCNDNPNIVCNSNLNKRRLNGFY